MVEKPNPENQYRKLNNTYFLDVRTDPRDSISVEIGDSKQPDFKPQVKLMRWDNEVNFSVRLTENGKETPSVSLKDDKVTWEKGNFKIESYEGDNCHKYVWYLKEKPATNKVQFSIQSKGLNFYYQPELTQKEIDDGAFRPENVVGSYAVYMENPGTNWVGGKEYKAGKFGHIFRPHLYDSNGLEAWGDLHIENGLYEVTIPQEFLDKAVFPIKSNDTFGYEDIGKSSEYISGDSGYFYTAQPSNSGNVDSISFYDNEDDGNYYKPVIWDSSDDVMSNGVGNILFLDWDAATAWYSLTYTTKPSVVASTNYKIGFIPDWSATSYIYYDTGGTANDGYDLDNSYSSPESLTTPYTVSERKYSIYATYTPAATTIIGPFPTHFRI